MFDNTRHKVNDNCLELKQLILYGLVKFIFALSFLSLIFIVDIFNQKERIFIVDIMVFEDLFFNNCKFFTRMVRINYQILPCLKNEETK